MRLSEKQISEYKQLHKLYLGCDISIEQAGIEARQLLRIIRILKRRTV